MKRKVYFEGELGEKFGKQREIFAPKIADIFKCLACNFSNFTEYLLDLDKRGLDLKCNVNGTDLKNIEELQLLYKKGDVTVSIVPAGSNKAVKVVVGVALIIAAPGIGTALGGELIAASTITSFVTSVGVSLLTAGAMEYLAPSPPTADDPKKIKRDDGYLYNGAEQGVLDTDPVPVCYGRVRVPARAVSFEIRNENSVILG